MFTCSIIVRFFFFVQLFSRLFVSFSPSSYYVYNFLRCNAKHLITCSLPAFEYLGAVILFLFLFCSLLFRFVLFGFVLFCFSSHPLHAICNHPHIIGWMLKLRYCYRYCCQPAEILRPLYLGHPRIISRTVTLAHT